MSKKVLILSGSPRKNGNSDILCDEFMRGAKDRGNAVEKIRVYEKNISYCRGCCVCQATGTCVIKDDMNEVIQCIIDADVLVLASPIYFYTMSAGLKTLLERTFARGKEVHHKEFYYIVSAADEAIEDAETAIESFRGYARCTEHAVEKGIVYAMGVYEKGAVKETKAMNDAYEMGKSIK